MPRAMRQRVIEVLREQAKVEFEAVQEARQQQVWWCDAHAASRSSATGTLLPD